MAPAALGKAGRDPLRSRLEDPRHPRLFDSADGLSRVPEPLQRRPFVEEAIRHDCRSAHHTLSSGSLISFSSPFFAVVCMTNNQSSCLRHTLPSQAPVLLPRHATAYLGRHGHGGNCLAHLGFESHCDHPSWRRAEALGRLPNGNNQTTILRPLQPVNVYQRLQKRPKERLQQRGRRNL